ncbi:MAG TPA: phosphate-starvation-inducible PsiE family protein [Puia sp.]|nr:phosphate-starvation-inducible PsiE family protein [Puia sp.]
MERFVTKFEKIVSQVLIVAGLLLISFQVVALVWEIFESFSERFKAVGLRYAPEYGKTVIVLFFNVLLALEVLQTVRIFDKSHIFKIRIILVICLIAVSRKVLMLDIYESKPETELTLAALILALSVGYFLVNRSVTDKAEE